MSNTPVVLQLNTTEYRAALLLEMLAAKAKDIPRALPERAEWLGLAREVADGLVDYLTHEEPRTDGRRSV